MAVSTTEARAIAQSREVETKTIALKSGREVEAKTAFSIPLDNGRAFEAYIVEKRVNCAESEEVRTALGIKAVKYTTALPALAENPAERTSIEGRSAYLDGVGLTEDGICAWNKKGELVMPPKNADAERLVRAFSGNQPLRLDVVSGDVTAVYGGRFGLYADGKPDYAVSVVLGIREKTYVEAATQKLESPRRLGVEAAKTERALGEQGMGIPETFKRLIREATG